MNSGNSLSSLKISEYNSLSHSIGLNFLWGSPNLLIISQLRKANLVKADSLSFRSMFF